MICTLQNLAHPFAHRLHTRAHTPILQLFHGCTPHLGKSGKNSAKTQTAKFRPTEGGGGRPHQSQNANRFFFSKIWEKWSVQVCTYDIVQHSQCANACATGVQWRVQRESAGTTPAAKDMTIKSRFAGFLNNFNPLLHLPPVFRDPGLMSAIVCGDFALLKLLVILALTLTTAAIAAVAKALADAGVGPATGDLEELGGAS